MATLTRPVLMLALSGLLGGCAGTGPAYQVPSVATPAHFKEAPTAQGWAPAAPADEQAKGPWWQRFGDAQLDALAPQVEVRNQTVAAAVARYAAAQALVAGQRASLLPTVQLTGSGTRSGGGGDAVTANAFRASVGASWEPDLWGRLSASVRQAQANAQASAADLAAATLSAQAALASNYFSLREADAELALLRDTVAGYERSLQITDNRYAAGQVARTDVLQAQTQLANARADLAGLVGQRAQFEHAIAVLLGQAPADISIAAAPWTMTAPEPPLTLPSELLQRRPDIASAERAVAAANANIGIARAAYFPSLTLSASGGTSATRLADLFSASHTLWSLGLSLAQILFDGGALNAALRNAEASRDVTIATYRQTVLTAFQSVEDLLSTRLALNEQLLQRQQASAAADLSEQQVLNRYRAGQVGYTEVVTAQSSAASARRSVVQLQSSRQLNAIALIQALGGGWQVAQGVAP
ncbi:efflux transporter outer membrane subunit [Aquabacterium sp.]|uniref:efflux transporter outer membrane subunit n=1 Tax=Aquabacterium sp. TaxID=1872578 RepID=UPI002D1290FE|nr:efflux transporter outer membrane subunit [Aquabacterium sp.]HSW03856.1 efflux transporter outer membrane subunit [Aquabacterium sp.]